MKKVLIYCASGAGERVAYSLDEERFSVVGLVDSNPETWGRRLFGLDPVLPPSDIPQIDYDLIIIGISEYEKEIKEDLIGKYGVSEDKIVTYQPQMCGINWEDERVIALKKCVSLMKERNICGDMAEVGVYRGDFSKLLNRCFPDRRLFLFDTFSGFDAEQDSVNDVDVDNFKDTSVDLVLSKMITPEKCIVRKGYFPDTAAGIDAEFSLVSLDCDLYEPTFAGLNFFYPRLVTGGYIIIHDFGSYHYEGVKKAVYEYCKDHDVALFPIVDRCLSVIISK